MSSKAKSVARPARSVKTKSIKAKTIGVRSIKTRTSLKGVNIYPASVEPSKRVKQIVAELTGASVAA